MESDSMELHFKMLGVLSSSLAQQSRGESYCPLNVLCLTLRTLDSVFRSLIIKGGKES